MKQSQFPNLVKRAVALAAIATLLAGCGGGNDEKAGATPAQPGQSSAAAGAPAAQPAETPEDKNLANAVVMGKTAAAVDLKYDLPAKPAVGEPFEIELTFLPRMAADRLEVEVTGIPGLTLVSGGTVAFDHVGSGDRHVTRVLARADTAGIYYVGIAVRMVSKLQTDARTFSIPVVIGAVAAAEKPAPETDASGQAVESMPAVEGAGSARQP